MNVVLYTFTEEELRAFLTETLTKFTKQKGVFDYSLGWQAIPDTVNQVISELKDTIPFNGEPVPYETDDTGPAELGLGREW